MTNAQLRTTPAPGGGAGARPRLSRRQTRGVLLAGLLIGVTVAGSVVVIGWAVIGFVGALPGPIALLLSALLWAGGWVGGYGIARTLGVHRALGVASIALAATVVLGALVAVVIALLGFLVGAVTLVFLYSGAFIEPAIYGSVAVVAMLVVATAVLSALVAGRALRAPAPAPPPIGPPATTRDVAAPAGAPVPPPRI